MSETVNRKPITLGTLAIFGATAAMLYPVLAITLAQIHYTITSKDLSERTLALLLLSSGPMFLLCLFTLFIANRAEGGQRTAGVICSVLGGIFNFLFLMIAGVGY